MWISYRSLRANTANGYFPEQEMRLSSQAGENMWATYRRTYRPFSNSLVGHSASRARLFLGRADGNPDLLANHELHVLFPDMP